ncbi:aminopeptidase P N-terminal domain-containing protein [Acetatifactor aquisgranensis]|uniref:aminopeptidase P N-terminal domain-containing protein n=1 Tax=Acetatifactor aquisgranensis TaxID=2941233 RepID=UPI00203B5495|nr:aminopeptidase P N-terminal domain-containing protein [Acetatifactor aquisgranensis]
MKKEFHQGNRARVYEAMKPHSLLVMFSGTEVRKTNDEQYPFYTDRNFLYLTGLDSKEFVLLASKDAEGQVKERIYILPPDLMTERWTGARIKADEAAEQSGIEDVAYVGGFEMDFHRLASMGNYGYLYLDTCRAEPGDRETPAHRLCRRAAVDYPFLKIENANAILRRLRTIKQPCEIEAIREAEKITRDGIVAMMKASKPGMYEYQYKAVFDYALGQHGPQGPAFPSIISAGRNNFCIHYYAYKGQAHDGDMILNDVGAWYDNLMTDVSRGWPCNGKYDERQRLLYECALKTSDHMFDIIKPGMAMEDVDRESHRYNALLLKDAGVLGSVDEIGTYMWHGGSHHVGYDVHDVVERPEFIAPNMVFCVDIGIYHEEWGIGFRLEDNCLVTEDGCENLSAITPRTMEEIEDTMKKGSVAVS